MKGAIVAGAIGLVYLLVAFVASLPPFGGGATDDESVVQTRGIGGGQ